MENVISEIRQICKAECCTVLLLNNDEENYSILATDFRENSSIKRVTEFKDFYDIASSWIDMIGSENDCVIIQDKNDIDYYSRVNNPWYLTLVEAGVESVVLFPLRQGHEILGFIWATNFDTNDTMRIKETLELTTFFVSSYIARYKVLKRLKHMSYTDALTGLPNRFACTEYIADLVSRGEKFAAVSIDINHFKSINDTLGLEAGNHVLIGVAERWRSVYNDESIAVPNYITRINGDEFLLVIWGYSSLSYLSKIPANLLKIDKSFIDRINTNESSKQYVAAMISMGHIMGLEVISEGVEQPEQIEALRSVGCDLIQGFIWGRPMSAEDVGRLVADITSGKS